MKQPHWVKVGLILRRELRDQFRDRRTIFMIAILPLLLYPLLSIGMLQVAQFLKKHPSRVLIVVGDGLPAPCPWLTRAQRHVRETPNDTLLKIELRETSTEELRRVEQAAPDMIERGAYDAVVIHGKSMEPGSHDDAQKLDRLPDEDDSVDGTPRDSINESNDLASKPRPAGGAYCRDSDSLNGSSELATPLVYYSAAKDRSRMAFQRISDALEIWRREAKSACASNPEIPNVPRTIATSSAQVNGRDVSNPGRRHAALWSKILPFVVFVWALTGAFYPAIDLCAGEKERGTLETLLASAAERLDIVWGKLLTTMIFSGATAILNMICMIGTAFF
ncbi:MAG TPA: ABC transporter permease subunit, partial [Pirellulaceae bacterium]